MDGYNQQRSTRYTQQPIYRANEEQRLSRLDEVRQPADKDRPGRITGRQRGHCPLLKRPGSLYLPYTRLYGMASVNGRCGRTHRAPI